MRTSFMLFFSLFISVTYAQESFTISGYIEDSQSGEALISANVFEGNKKLGTVSNLYGFYSITLPKDSVYLSFSYIGYESQVMGLYLDKDITLDVGLNSSTTLKQVEIVAENSVSIEEESQMSTIEVPIKQIKKIPALLGEVDVLKTLQLLPGVQSGGEGQSGLYVRGGSPDQNLILLDGVPVYNANHLFGFFSVFNADAIKDVKLTKGGYPARYGGRLSSVLEINMKEGNKQEFHGSGAIGLISSKLSLEGPIIKDKASFIISGRRTYIDVLARPLIKASFRANSTGNTSTDGNIGYFFYDLNAKVNYKLSDKDKLYLSAYTGDDKFYVDIKETFGENTDRIQTELGWGNFTSALRWNHLWTNKLFSNVTATYTRYNFGTLLGTEFSSNISGQEESEAFSISYDSGIRDYAVRVDFDFLPSPNHFIRFGGLGMQHRFNPGEFNLKSEVSGPNNPAMGIDTTFGQELVDALEYNFFVEDDFKISPTLKINAGVHFSGFNLKEQGYTSLQPRISIRQLLPGKVALKGSFATMRQYTQYLTNENIGLPWDQWLPTTKKVLPQDSWQAAIGFAKTLEGGYEVSLEGYYKEMDNLISYEEGASFFSLESWEELVTQGEGRSYGAELFVQKKTGKFTGWLGYTLSWSERRFDDKNFGEWYPFKFDRRHDLSLVGIYELSENINLAATWVYGTGNAVTFAESRVPLLTNPGSFGEYVTTVDVFKNRNNFRLEPYHRLDVNIDFIKQKKFHKRIWSFGAYNAYSRKNPFFLNLEEDFVENPDGSFSTETVLKQYSLFPIIPSVSYRFEF